MKTHNRKKILALAILAQILAAPHAHARAYDFFSFFIFRDERPAYKGSYSFQQYPKRAIQNQNRSLKETKQSVDMIMPLSTASDEKWYLNASMSDNELDATVTLPNTQPSRELPHHLWDISIGPSFQKNLANDKSLIASFSVGSPSDKPFANWDTVGVHANLAYKVPTDAKNMWVYFLNVSNERSFLPYVPLPGFVYLWNASDSFKGMVGLPFFGFWAMPFSKTIITFFYAPPTNGQAKIAYMISHVSQVYAQFTSGIDTYLLFGRGDVKNRLFSEHMQASAGLNTSLAKHLSLDIASGYGFHRDLFQGHNFTNRNNGTRLNIDGGFFATAKLSTQF